jgi:hypothetical protein
VVAVAEVTAATIRLLELDKQAVATEVLMLSVVTQLRTLAQVVEEAEETLPLVQNLMVATVALALLFCGTQ